MNLESVGLLLSSAPAVRLRHALAYAKEIRRNCIVNKIPCSVFADKYGLDREQVLAARSFLAQLDFVPPPEVCAGVASLDQGLDASDIAEMFGRSERWAEMAKERREEFCAEIGARLDLSPWVMPGDPAPEEIWTAWRKPKRMR